MNKCAEFSSFLATKKTGCKVKFLPPACVGVLVGVHTCVFECASECASLIDFGKKKIMHFKIQ